MKVDIFKSTRIAVVIIIEKKGWSAAMKKTDSPAKTKLIHMNFLAVFSTDTAAIDSNIVAPSIRMIFALQMIVVIKGRNSTS